MPTTIEGRHTPGDGAYAVVVSRWNELVTERLLEAALRTLARHGVPDERITVVRVPGSFEIPAAAHRLARSGKFAGVICLGAVIQGETTHDQYINAQVAAGIARAAESSGIPVTFGVLTCQTTEQALERAGGKAGNKGEEAALAALEMADLFEQLDERGIALDARGGTN